MAEVTMPRLSDTMSEGSVGRWLKKPGDHVEKDEVIAEIETDKATMELVAFESGTLQQILVEEGKVVPIGAVIGVIGDGPAPAGAAAPAGAPGVAGAAGAAGAAKDARAEAKPDVKKSAPNGAPSQTPGNGAAASAASAASTAS